MTRWPNLDHAAIEQGTKKQATIPAGATILEPVGTAPGLVVEPRDGEAGPTIVVLPGPPRELQPMWSQAVATDAFKRAIAGATSYRQQTLRLFGMPESEIAETLRVAERDGVALDHLEITTCLKRGEIEVVTRYEPDAQDAYDAFAQLVAERHADTLFSSDGSSIDELVARALAGQTIATAESCTGGLLAARLTDRPGSSAYVKGGVVVYSNDAKIELAGVERQLIEKHGAVSQRIAEALAEGARAALEAGIGVGITGIAGPDGGSEEKPVGLVWLSIAGPGERAPTTRSVNLPGGRADVRDRATTVAMHMLLRALS
jgi:nicotinamide-nucleotide amidase